MQETVSFPSGQVRYQYFEPVSDLWALYAGRQMIFITDETIEGLYPHVLGSMPSIVLPPGEDSKTMSMIEVIVGKLLKLGATRKVVLVGIGGGVISDITGFVSAIYMRGVQSVFVPTTLLGMVDAAIGGKNGVNIGVSKNMAGTIRQPDTLWFDTTFLATLPPAEWSNGFAEIIKYGCIFDQELFHELEAHDIGYYRENEAALQQLIRRCVQLKNMTVQEDELESGKRKLLNFGHTSAHAIEKLYELPHGQAVAIGMVVAAVLSEQLGFARAGIADRIRAALVRYGLPTGYIADVPRVIAMMQMDKKRDNDHIDYILLADIGAAFIYPATALQVEKAVEICMQ